MEEALRVVWHDLDDSNGNKTHSLLPLALRHKTGCCTPASAQESLFGASAEIQAQGVTQIPESAEQD